ncbi:MAG: PAS domain-containing protein, partial [Elusimicrobiales bacterium]|nr:PAS domain-containing protein [Elusimicrobiales bacterium]
MQDLHVSIAALKRKLGLLFLAAAAVIVAGALLYYRHYSRNVELEKDELLASIAKGKIQQLAVWREDRLARVRSLLDSPILSINLRRFADEPEDRENTSLVRRRLESFILNSVYRGAFLAERSGKILLSAGKLSPGAPCPEVRRLLAGAAAEHGPVIGEIHRDSAGKPGIHVVSLAAVSAAGKKIFLVTCIDPEDYLYPLVQAWPTNSASAETLLVKEDKGEILFLNELRNKKDTALNFRLPSDTPSLPAAAGVRGITGVMRGVDYRGVKVLAYTAPVPGSNWSLVAKIDESEVFSETRTPSALLVLLVLTMLGASGIGAFLLFRLQTEAYLRAYQEAHADKARAEDALQETEEIFNQFMEHNPLYVFFKDENLRALHLSRNFETWLGRPMNDLLGKSMAELFPSELADKIVADDKRILAEGKEVIVEEELHGRSYRTIKFPIRVPGKPAYLAGYTMDITEYKQALKALEEGRRLLAETEKVGKVGGWEFNIDTMRQRWTDEVYSIHELEITPDPTVAAGINYYTPESR